jgi:uncharacterized protein YndB with AHSA1/START domain
MATTKITAPPGTPFIDLEREFDAPRDLVYRAHTDPDLLVRWLGPRRMTMTIDRFEVRDGGTWRYVHRGPDGDEHGFHGVFHGEPSPDLLVQTFEYEGAPGHVSLETLRLEERDGRTVLRARSVHGSVEARDAMVESGMEGGVNEGYERLDEVLAERMQAQRAGIG